MKIDSKLILEYSKDLSVLYVEDDDIIRQATTKILSHYFKEVSVAVDGKEGLKKFIQFKNNNDVYYDLIISDINMPFMNGIEMSVAIMAENPYQSIIFNTADNDTSFLEDAIKIGVDGFLHKPINLDQLKILLYKISRAINNRKLNEAFQKQLEIKVAQQSKKLEEFYLEDKLTGLGNMNALNARIDKKSNIVIILININKFHEINEYYGFETGDSFLLQMTDFLLETFKGTGEVYRGNSDEFVVLSDLKKISFSALLELLKVFSKSMLTHMFYTSTKEMQSEISIPLQITMGLSNSEHKILQYANIALHQAKLQKKELIVFKDELLHEKNYKKNFEMVRTVYDAIMGERIIAYYQPIVDNQTQKIVKYETLVRLIDMKNNILLPFEFLDIAKKGRLYPYITRAVFKQACEKFKNRSELFSINIELEDITNPTTNAFILKTVGMFSEPERIVIEIVESQHLEQNDILDTFLSELKKKGCKVSIDDFGTGYSNFEYLLHLNADIIKVDGSLIKNIDNNEESRIIVESIVRFSKKMGLKTVAEFVSSESIYNVVNSMGITYSQGFYFGKPKAMLV